MKRIIIFCLLMVILGATTEICAQNDRRKGKYQQRPDQTSDFLKTQWWLGFYGGTNLVSPQPGQRYTGMVALNYDDALNEKLYDEYTLPGGQSGISITFYHRGFSFVFSPNYRVERFAYSNTHTWESDENLSNSLTLTYEQENRLQFIELPVYIKYDLMTGRLRPFIQAGVYYRRLINAEKTVMTSGVDYASGGSGPFESEAVSVGTTSLFADHTTGIAGGVGCTYDIWNVRFSLDIIYQKGLNNIANTENRYSENPVTGIGDAMDDLQLNAVSINVGCVFPLRFISKNLKAIE